MRILFCMFAAFLLAMQTKFYTFAHDEEGPITKPLIATKHSSSKDNVILISFDSFGWKYLDLVDTPVINTFKKVGVYADHMINVVPTVTFPNHVSLATGLYPESHGIISNNMYDPVFKGYFNMSVTDPKWWWHGVEPIWYTNEKQGGVSGVIWWPGYNIENYTATYYWKHNPDKLSYQERVDLALSWLKKDKPPNLIILYFEDLDHAGHKHGFGSWQTIREVKRIDNITGYLIEQLKQRNLLDHWNIILTADHGMTNVSRSRTINITNYVNRSDCIAISGSGGIHYVWPKEDKSDAMYEKLKANHHPHMQVYRKENFPRKYHHSNNPRVSPIVLTIDEGWTLIHHPDKFNFSKVFGGSHGYLTTVAKMWPIFFASGPAFKKGYHSKVFNSVDLYPLMCKLLKIKANPNNGSFDSVKWLLVGNNESSSMSPILIGVMVSSMFFALGILICGVTLCVSERKVKRFRTNRAWNNNMVMSQLEQSDKLLLNNDDDDEEDEFVAATSDTI